jgi:hypothetical protein
VSVVRRTAVLAALLAVAAVVLSVPSGSAATTGPLEVTIAGTLGEPGDTGRPASVAFTGTARLAGLVEDAIEGDGVLVAIESGDVNEPVVLGSLWSSHESPPETIACAGRICVLRGPVGGIGRLDAAEVELRPGGRVLLHVVVPRATCERCG